MAGNIQRIISSFKIICLKPRSLDRNAINSCRNFVTHHHPSHNLQSQSHLKLTPATVTVVSTPTYRALSSQSSSCKGQGSSTMGNIDYDAPIWLFSNPAMYRVPFKAPPITNQNLIINYKIPTRNPKPEILEDPSNINNNKTIEAPLTPNSQIEKQAARLIVIRRSKMNKHKLKKLRKKMKYVWAKVKTKRAIRREKEFLNSLMAKVREAEKFDAKTHVANIIMKAKEKPPVVMYWKRNRLPDYLVKEKLAQQALKEQQEYLSILDKRDENEKK